LYQQKTNKMTLKELVLKVDTNPLNESYVNWEGLSALLGVYGLQWSDDTRLKTYWLSRWMCTDTYVGIKVYMLDTLVVAVSSQPYRKSSEEFIFVSLDAAVDVKNYLLSLLSTDDLEIELWNSAEEMGEGFSVEYQSNINKHMHPVATLVETGQKVKIVGSKMMEHFNFHDITVEFEDGTKKVVDNRELLLPYNIITSL
jgi:hypothetical protein